MVSGYSLEVRGQNTLTMMHSALLMVRREVLLWVLYKNELVTASLCERINSVKECVQMCSSHQVLIYINIHFDMFINNYTLVDIFLHSFLRFDF